MVSLKQRQDLLTLAEADPQLKRFQLLLLGEIQAGDKSCGGSVHDELLNAISSKDASRFKDLAVKIGQRKISADSDWCQDDYLLFLLILGNEMFGRTLTYLSNVIDVRQHNANPIPRKINEIYAALVRQEFGIEGEFCFLKIPFLRLAGKLRLGPQEAMRALKALSVPGYFDQMSPFLKLLTLMAYDIILTERQPIETETTMQLIEGFEVHAKNLSLRQWWRVVLALPGRIILAFIMLIAGFGLIPVLFGVGKGLVESHMAKELRTRPTAIAVVSVREPGPDLPTEALLLAKSLSLQSSLPGKKVLLVTVEGTPFTTPTPSFVVEVSHPDKPIKNAFAFTQGVTEGVRPFTVVPVQRDGGRFRAILPEQPLGHRLVFVIEFEVNDNEEAKNIGRSVVLRPLQ